MIHYTYPPPPYYPFHEGSNAPLSSLKFPRESARNDELSNDLRAQPTCCGKQGIYNRNYPMRREPSLLEDKSPHPKENSTSRDESSVATSEATYKKQVNFCFAVRRKKEKRMCWMADLNECAITVDRVLQLSDGPIQSCVAFSSSNLLRANCRALRYSISPGDFDRLALLGKGGFGTVYKVKHKETGGLYALKQVPKSKLRKNVSRLRMFAERDVLAKVDSDFIVKLFSTFQDEHNLYQLMEILPGRTLMFWFEELNQFDEETTRFYIAELVSAILAIHKCQYTHRDVKPDNMVFTSSGHLKLLDFGLAKHCYQKRDCVWEVEDAEDRQAFVSSSEKPETPSTHAPSSPAPHLYRQEGEYEASESPEKKDYSGVYTLNELIRMLRKKELRRAEDECPPEDYCNTSSRSSNYSNNSPLNGNTTNEASTPHRGSTCTGEGGRVGRKMGGVVCRNKKTGKSRKMKESAVEDFDCYSTQSEGAGGDSEDLQAWGGAGDKEGISLFQPSQRMLKSRCGTLFYQAPEVLRLRGDERYTSSIDWWSVGVVMFEALYGGIPFYTPIEPGVHPGDFANFVKQMVLMHKQTCPIPYPSDNAPNLSPEAIDLLKRLICEPEERITDEEIKLHPFFASIDWENLSSMKAPFADKVKMMTTHTERAQLHGLKRDIQHEGGCQGGVLSQRRRFDLVGVCEPSVVNMDLRYSLYEFNLQAHNSSPSLRKVLTMADSLLTHCQQTPKYLITPVPSDRAPAA